MGFTSCWLVQPLGGILLPGPSTGSLNPPRCALFISCKAGCPSDAVTIDGGMVSYWMEGSSKNRLDGRKFRQKDKGQNMKSQHQIYLICMAGKKGSSRISIFPEPNIMLVLSQPSGYQRGALELDVWGSLGKGCILTSGFCLETVYSYLSSQVSQVCVKVRK